MYICVCVCVCVCERFLLLQSLEGNQSRLSAWKLSIIYARSKKSNKIYIGEANVGNQGEGEKLATRGTLQIA